MSAPDPEPDLPPALNPATLTTAIASLAPALELLERFHHRNKNQHRLSKWWAQADMLRRHVRKMLGELEAGVEGAERAVRVREKQRLKGKGKGKVVGDDKDGEGLLGKRAGYLRWRLGPGAFLAFTQLSADRQFAHLGLMLLGVLAQVDKAVAPFAPPPPLEVGEETGDQAAAAVQPVSGRHTETGEDHDSMMEMDIDMGVAVSREEIMASIERDTATPLPPLISATQPSQAAPDHPRSISLPINRASKTEKLLSQTQTAQTEPTSKEPSVTPSAVSANPRKKRPRKAEDEFDDIFSSLERPLSSKTKPRSAEPQAKQPSSKGTSATGTPAPDPAMTSKTKKPRGEEGEAGGKGDEFDIFASLDSKTKKPKKKKRKKGDEFDDIFGGL